MYLRSHANRLNVDNSQDTESVVAGLKKKFPELNSIDDKLRTFNDINISSGMINGSHFIDFVDQTEAEKITMRLGLHISLGGIKAKPSKNISISFHNVRLSNIRFVSILEETAADLGIDLGSVSFQEQIDVPRENQARSFLERSVERKGIDLDINSILPSPPSTTTANFRGSLGARYSYEKLIEFFFELKKAYKEASQ